MTNDKEIEKWRVKLKHYTDEVAYKLRKEKQQREILQKLQEACGK